jgi:hypothetical protein
MKGKKCQILVLLWQKCGKQSWPSTVWCMFCKTLNPICKRGELPPSQLLGLGTRIATNWLLVIC